MRSSTARFRCRIGPKRGLSASDLRSRAEAPTQLITAVARGEVGADGLLARRVVGDGVLLWVQLDPERLNADKNTYLRFTRWHQTRALSQLLAHLGATFPLDKRIFAPENPEAGVVLPLVGTWQGKLVQRLAPASAPGKGHAAPDLSAAARQLVGMNAPANGWMESKMPQQFEHLGGEWKDADGEVVFRRTVEVPTALQGQDLVLSLAELDDFDEVFFNGVSIGKTGAETPNYWSVKRGYTVPKVLVKPGQNVITVRIWDRFAGSGFSGTPKK